MYNIDSNKLPRTRVIPMSDYYTRLQLEYLSYRMRALTYQRGFDKKKFEDICAGKRKKIEQIALENRLPSIFNSSDQQSRYLSKFLNPAGCPNFCYRDDYQRKVKGYWDRFYYFGVGSSVKVIINDTPEIGRIVAADVQASQLTVTVDKHLHDVALNDAVRIFPSDFYARLFV